MKKLIILSLSLIFLFSCEKDEQVVIDDPVNLPIVSFSYVIDNQFPPAKVTFTNTSAFSTTYFWNFGDGTTSTEQNPVHIFQTSGGFSVSLTAGDDEGNTKIQTQTVFVSELPTKFLLKRLTIKQMPFSNNVGQSWDTYDGPDVFIYFQEMSFDIFAQTDIIENIEESDLPVSWNWDDPYFNLVDIGHNFQFVFVDHDGPNIYAPMDIPLEFDFNLSPDYPLIIEMTSQTGLFEIELEVVWQ